MSELEERGTYRTGVDCRMTHCCGTIIKKVEHVHHGSVRDLPMSTTTAELTYYCSECRVLYYDLPAKAVINERIA